VATFTIYHYLAGSACLPDASSTIFQPQEGTVRFSKLIARAFFVGALVTALASVVQVPRARATNAECADGNRNLCATIKSRDVTLYYYWV
jgi:hypothetical protein